MNETTPIFWGIHGGKTGDADTLFRKQHKVALGWTEMPDLQTLVQDRDTYKSTLINVNPDLKPGAVPVAAGQMFRFVNEMRAGDYAIYRSKVSQKFHIGIIQGGYQYSPDINPSYPHQRDIKWVKEIFPTVMSQGALYEMGSAMSLFQVRNYADEWYSHLSSPSTSTPTSSANKVEDDESVLMVAESIDQNTRDFILKQFQAELKGHPFAEFVGHLLNKMGYVVRVSPPGADGGVDIIAHRDELGFEPPIIKVQVKSQDGNVGHQDVAYLVGTLAPQGEFGLVVSLSDFSNAARNFAKGKANIRILNANDVIDLTLMHYESLDSKYKAIIPMKQVFVPTPLDD